MKLFNTTVCNISFVNIILMTKKVCIELKRQDSADAILSTVLVPWPFSAAVNVNSFDKADLYAAIPFHSTDPPGLHQQK